MKLFVLLSTLVLLACSEKAFIEEQVPSSCSSEILQLDIFPTLLPDLGKKRQESNDDNLFSGLGFYGNSPQRESVNQLVYTEAHSSDALNPVSGLESDQLFSGALMIKNTNTNDVEKLINLDSFSIHNTTTAMWLGDQQIAYYEGFNQKVFVIDPQSKQLLCNGAIDGRLGQKSSAGRFLVLEKSENSDFHDQISIYRCFATNQERIEKNIAMDAGSLEQLKTFMEGSDDTRDWRYDHLQFSPNGNNVAFNIQPQNSKFKYLTSFSLENSKITFFGIAPLHWQWHDEGSFFGHDYNVADGMQNNGNLRRWDLTGNYIETLVHNAIDIQSASANSSVNDTSPANIIDSDEETSWSVDSLDSYLDLDLGEVRNLNQLTILFKKESSDVPNISLQSSVDENEWTAIELLTPLNNERSQTLTFAPTKARFVRIIANGTSRNHWLHIKEVFITRHGNHVAMSPDQQWFVTESYYNDDLISLYLYKKGERAPRAILAKNCYDEITWAPAVRVHMNPSFSESGTRIYFNEATSQTSAQVFSYDISTIINDASSSRDL